MELDAYGWTPRPGYSGDVYGADRKFDLNGYLAADSAQVKSTKPKIVFFGDSCTFGNGIATDETFVEVVGTLLPDVASINLAVPGYTSLQGCMRLKNLAFDPDVVVFSFSFNDRRYVTRAKTRRTASSDIAASPKSEKSAAFPSRSTSPSSYVQVFAMSASSRARWMGARSAWTPRLRASRPNATPRISSAPPSRPVQRRHASCS